ncbi:MAG: hypothetical protein U1A27_09420 [Phycisphaerae bacterium]
MSRSMRMLLTGVLAWPLTLSACHGLRHDYDRDDRPSRPHRPDDGADYRPQRWRELGGRSVDSTHARPYMIDCRADSGPYRQVRFTVNGGAMELRDVEIVFGNGRPFSPVIRDELGGGARTRVIDLPGTYREIRGVRFVARAMNHHDRPMLTVFAR